jgi:hypothetical protein
LQDTCQCWAGYTGSDCSTKTTRSNQCNKLVGVNLEGVRDWSSNWAFVDIMKSARGFLSQAMDAVEGGATSLAWLSATTAGEWSRGRGMVVCTLGRVVVRARGGGGAIL